MQAQKEKIGQAYFISSSQDLQNQNVEPDESQNFLTVQKGKNQVINENKIQNISNFDSEENWRPVKIENTLEKPIVKFQSNRNSKKSQQRFLRQKYDLNNPNKAKSQLKRLAVQYHKSLMEQTMERHKMQQESGIKNEEEWVQIDKNLRYFPLDNQMLKTTSFASIQELTAFLQVQETEIIKQLGDDLFESVFCANFKKMVRKQCGQKEFVNLKCGINGCKAILKCIFEKQKQKCQIYLLRNKHSHTIGGISLESQQKIQEQVVLDDSLHDMFGFRKGVRSETRNLKYFDPKERRLRAAQLRRQAKLKRKCKQQQNPSKNDEGQAEINMNQIIKTKREEKYMPFLKNKKQKPQFRQFINMQRELTLQGLSIVDLGERSQSAFVNLGLITRKDWVQKALNTTTLRLIIFQGIIKVDRNKQNENNTWSLAFITALNPALKPTTLAIGISSKPLPKKVSLVLECFFKISKVPDYLITQYIPEIIDNLKQTIQKQHDSLTISLDTNNVLSLLKKQLKNEKYMKALAEFVKPTSSYQRQSFRKYFTKRNQANLLEAYQKFSEFITINPSEKGHFHGFQVNLSAERQLISKIRHKLRHLRGRYTLKYQLGKVLEVVYSQNKRSQQMLRNQQILQIEKIHRDVNLLSVRKNVTPNVLNQFYLQYGEALNLTFKEGGSSGQYLFEKERVTLQNLKCSCQYYEITGLPCRHMIKVLKAKNSPYLPYIDKKWFVHSYKNSQERQRTRDKKKNIRKRLKDFLHQTKQ